MNYMYRQMPQTMQGMQPKQVTVVEPYVYAAATTLVGKRAVVETTRGNVSGVVMDAKPDHIVLQERESTFFVRLCEVVWIMPE
ncbi:YuzF family protein [Bacillus pinisoli]|uniref:YuzF family protein n=1 Tax=Bacillus pinisoli TaxID=2901866 RepID=UPI001FF0F566|nr:YuzF family protein [Bacillus pinisoli]